MPSARDAIVDWAEQGRLAPEALPQALALARVTPDGASWRRFIATLLLGLGALLIAAGVIFFFAYNWQAIGRFEKFALVQGVIAIAVFGAWFYGPAKTAGQAALLLSALLVGALLALIGQTYQTGADPWELFALWALLILPWVIVSEMAVLWLLLLALVNVSVVLHVQTFGGLFGLIFGTERLLWMLFALNAAALVAWEMIARRDAAWMAGRWTPRIIAVAAGTLVTSIALWATFEWRGVSPLAFPAYVLWAAANYVVYRLKLRDLFMLAGGVLSGIVVIAAILTRVLGDMGTAAGSLFIGLLVVGMSAAAALWLRRVAEEDEA